MGTGDSQDISAPEAGATPTSEGPPWILVVEDHPMNRKVIATMLETLGYLVETAVDGLDAVEACARRGYDAVLMDCQMPEMDGLRATAWIREREGPQRRTPILALTASVLPGDKERCFAAGMDDFLAKPIGMSALDGALRKWTRPGSAPARRAAQPTPSQLPDDHPLRVLEAQGRAAVVVEVIDLFLQTTPLRIEAMRSAHRQGDTTAVLSLGHSLKGAAFQLGARALAELCQRVQAEAREGKLEELGRLLDALEAEFDSVSVVLKGERDRLSQRRI